MFWHVNLCFFLMINTAGSSNIEFTKTIQINYKDNENLQVTVKFENPVSYSKVYNIYNYKLAKIQFTYTEGNVTTTTTITTCKFNNTGDQRHLNFNLSNLIKKYDKADVIVYLCDDNVNPISTKILLQLVYDPKRSEKPHECLVHCIINFDIINIFLGSQSTYIGKQNEESAKPHEFIQKIAETKISNNRPTTRTIKLYPNISTYYYFPNTNLTLTCNASNLLLKNSNLVLYKGLKILEAASKNTLEYNLDLKVEDNYSSFYCAKEKYKSNNITLQLNETYVGSTTITEDNKNTDNYHAYALEALLAVIGILLLSIILVYWRKSRAAHSAAPENDVYTYATSQLTYAQLQLNAHEEKNRQVTKSVPYATIVGVLKPKT